MNKNIAFLFPGQGAQYPGMGQDFYQQFKEAKEIFDRADTLLGTAFSKEIFEGPLEKLTLTKNSQLAIFVTSIALLEVFKTHFPELTPLACAGLSLGEYTALVAAEKLSFEEALLLVKARALLMQEACEKREGGMDVVLGLEPPHLEQILKECEEVQIANVNCPGQIVISGTKKGLEKARDFLKEKGARRVMPLEVSGAFHSFLMQSAGDGLQEFIDKIKLKESSILMVMNVFGEGVEDSNQIKAAMSAQVTSPVYWQKGIEYLLKEKKIDLFVEIGPGKTLAGMNKRIGAAVPTLNLEKVEDLSNLMEIIVKESHAAT